VRTLVVAVIAIVACAAGVVLGLELDEPDSAAAGAATSSGLPTPVDETRARLLEAAESGDYEALRPLISDTSFKYTFGDGVEGGPIAYWRELERTTDQRPIEALADVLRLPYALSRGSYAWPWAHAVSSSDDLSPHERELLAPLGLPSQLFPEGAGYYGWRAGIAPDGTWVYFVAGD
jgi:hypothetical protein